MSQRAWVIILSILFALAALIAQAPKEVLSPQLYDQLAKQSGDRILSRLDQFEAKQTADLAKVKSDHMAIEMRQQAVQDQLSGLLELQKSVAANHERVSSLEDRVGRLEVSGGGAPASIAVLESRMNSIIWVLCTFGGAMLAGIAYILKQNFSFIFSRKQVAEMSLASHQEIIDAVADVKEAANSAYAVANTVNEKIETIGVEMRDRKRLPHE